MHKIYLALFATLTLLTSLAAAPLSQENKNSSLILYNSNMALLHQEKKISLEPEETTLSYEGIPKSIKIDSLSTTLPEGVSLISQNYRYNKLTLAKLLQENLNKKVEVRLLKNRNDFQRIFATLLSFDTRSAILKTIDYKIITVDIKNIIFSDIPQELMSQPMLTWKIKTDKAIKGTMKLDYLVNNISYKSNYILNLQDQSASLDGYFSINNRSGKRYKDIKLSIFSGNIHQAKQVRPIHYTRAVSMDASANIKKQSIEGNYFYTLPTQVTLQDQETTQVKFLHEQNITVERQNSVMMSNPIYFNKQKKNPILQTLKIQNLKEVLPKGDVHIYTTRETQKILLGADTIQNTPKGDAILLKAGDNFDLWAKETLLKRGDTKSLFNVDIVYTLHNASNKEQSLDIKVPFNRQEHSALKTDQPYTYIDGSTLAFHITLGANSTYKYTVHYQGKK